MVPYVMIASLAALGACLSGSPSSQDCSVSWGDYMEEVSNKPSAESWREFVKNHSVSSKCEDFELYGLETRNLKGKLSTADSKLTAADGLANKMAGLYLQETEDLEADGSKLTQLKVDKHRLGAADSKLKKLKADEETLNELKNKADSKLQSEGTKLKSADKTVQSEGTQLKSAESERSSDEKQLNELSEMEKKSMTCPTTLFYTYSDSEYRTFVEHWDYEYDSKPFDFTHALCVLKKVNSPTSWDCDEYFKEVNSEYVLKHLFLPDTQKCTCPDGKPPTEVTGKTYYPSYGIQHHLAYYYTDLTYLYAHPHEC